MGRMLTFDGKNMIYDENGNLVSVTNSCGTTTYTWDARNRLVGINGFNALCATLSASFKYDALGRRIEKTINGRTIQYLCDGLDIVQEIENGVPSVNYVRTLNIDEPLVRITPGALRFYQTDALGSVIALTDENGVVKTTYSYDPFGNVIVCGETSDNPFQYTGRENDGTGLYYYRARYYSPELQRFISEDPLLSPNNPNILPYLISNTKNSLKYSYVENDPLNMKDPMGLAAISWPIPKCTPIGPSGQNCSVYKVDCDSGDRTACLLYQACLNLGDNPWSNCVRCCLQEKYRKCNTCGCVLTDHFDCWISCPPVFR